MMQYAATVTRFHCNTFLSRDALVLGKGTHVWKKTGAIYEGDWEHNLRHGFGTYNVLRNREHAKEYAGGWKNDKKHVNVVLYNYSGASE